ncbi:MAG: UDP-glucose 4-epimerase GalE [Ignavibacteriales bacterium]|nr:UDP-glucose 4-epimerase GalE [Ignavibacteriales bacterium]MCF8438200.1 UDP-glucose 4-epimerase GalE [Ignavibacteriales bacterium]
MHLLVTGGAGYIGSHFVKLALSSDHMITVADNLSRGHREAVMPEAEFVEVDLCDFNNLKRIVNGKNFDAVIHFAAFAYVGESVQNPLLYYQNNVIGTLNLIRAVNETGIKKFVFSSTCSVYGNTDIFPITEELPVNPINPYASGKLIIENVLRDCDRAYGLKSVCLRYFNAAGADPGSEIGSSHDPETRLLPLIILAALGKINEITVFGDDYNTPDGTCIRDYIHINDLADAHLRALNFLNSENRSDFFNLGTGIGISVLDMISRVEKLTGYNVPYKISERREGDPAILVADYTKAKNKLGWEPKFSSEDIILSAWRWYNERKY